MKAPATRDPRTLAVVREGEGEKGLGVACGDRATFSPVHLAQCYLLFTEYSAISN